MPFNGAGAYSLPAGSVVADGTTIDAADHNTPLLDIEAALSQTVLRNGATPFTGNQSMGNNKIVNLADGTVATDAPTLRQVQSGAASVATTVGGTANAVTLTFSPPFAAYMNNMTIRFRVGTANTGAVTVNVDTLGAKSLKKNNSGTLADMASGDLPAGMVVEALFSTADDCFVAQGVVGFNGKLNVPAVAGTANQVLRADGVWATPRPLLATLVTTSGSAAVFTSVPSMNGLRIVIRAVSSTGLAFLRIRLSSDNGATWSSYFQVSDVLAAAANFFHGVVDIDMANETISKTISALIATGAGASPVVGAAYSGGSFPFVNPINAIEISPSTGTFDNGDVRLYGYAA